METKPLLGIKYWAMWFPNKTPKYRVFKYEGKQGLFHFFKARDKLGTTMGFTEEQLAQLGYTGVFKPFMIPQEAWGEADAS